MSELRSAVSELTSPDPNSMAVAEVASEIAEVAYGLQMFEVYLSQLVRSISDRFGFRELGYSSATSLLTDTTGVSLGHARQVIGWSSIDDKAPHAYAAWADGRISTDQARHLFAAAESVPDVYREDEPALVEIVEGLDARDTRKAVEYWRQAVDGPGELSSDIQQTRRGLSASWVGNTLRVDGWLTTTAGQALLASLEANTPPRAEDDARTPRQRRHDALENLCRDWLDNGTTPTVGGEKPHMSLHVDLDALQGIAGGLHETEEGHLVDVDTARMIACDCSITRIVFGPESEVLDIGRRTRVWAAAQRRAIVARDRHCQGRGCRAKPRHCDIHHQTHWADGGETTVDEGMLLCRPCHTLAHAKDKHRRRRERART